MNGDVFEYSPLRPFVLFTGATGRVGSKVAPFLGVKHEFRFTDLRSSRLGNHPVHGANLLDLDSVIRISKGAQSIVHCAIASYPDPNNEPSDSEQEEYNQRMLDVNIRGTYNVFEAARINHVPQIIFISSLTVTLGHGETSGLSEDLSPKPPTLYACTKLFGEQLAEMYNRVHGLRVIVLRLGQPFPLGFIQEEIWEKEPRLRAFFVMHQDIARAIHCALEADDVEMGVYNVVSRDAEGFIEHRNAEEIGFRPICQWAPQLSQVVK